MQAAQIIIRKEARVVMLWISMLDNFHYYLTRGHLQMLPNQTKKKWSNGRVDAPSWGLQIPVTPRKSAPKVGVSTLVVIHARSRIHNLCAQFVSSNKLGLILTLIYCWHDIWFPQRICCEIPTKHRIWSSLHPSRKTRICRHFQDSEQD